MIQFDYVGGIVNIYVRESDFNWIDFYDDGLGHHPWHQSNREKREFPLFCLLCAIDIASCTWRSMYSAKCECGEQLTMGSSSGNGEMAQHSAANWQARLCLIWITQFRMIASRSKLYASSGVCRKTSLIICCQHDDVARSCFKAWLMTIAVNHDPTTFVSRNIDYTGLSD